MQPRASSKHTALILVLLVFLLIAGSRILRISLDQKELHVDEVWSVWQLLGPTTDYTRDANWPPLYYILLDGWQRLVGLQPLALRYLSVLMYLVGTACVYRAMRRLRSEQAGLLAALGYSAVALSTFFATQARPYILVFTLLPVAFWLTIRYFDRPQFRRAIPLALVLPAMFYTSYGSVGAFLLLGIYTLVVYRQAIWRWWLPGLMAGLMALPIVVGIMGRATGRLGALSTIKLPPLVPGVLGFYDRQTGYMPVVWILLFVVATIALIAMLVRHQSSRLTLLALFLWTLAPILLYVSSPILGLFDPTYGWFVILGPVLWIAWGLSYLPRAGQLGASILLVVVMFTPVPYSKLQAEPPPLGRSFAWLAQHVRWGDVITIDPLWKDRFCNCINPEVFQYLINLYFPQGLSIVTNPQGYRRVWYLKWDSLEDKDFEKTILDGRVAGVFVGPPEALFRLYEAPPNPQGILFENGLRFHGLEVLDQTPGPVVHRVGDTMRVRLWWSVDKPLPADYSIAIHVYLNGKLVIQSDSGPQLVDKSLPGVTSQWVPGTYYIEERELQIPKGLITGAYPIYLTVYQWWDQTRIGAPGVNQDKLLPVETLYIKAW